MTANCATETDLSHILYDETQVPHDCSHVSVSVPGRDEIASVLRTMIIRFRKPRKLGVAVESCPRVEGLDCECMAARCLYFRRYTRGFSALPPLAVVPSAPSCRFVGEGSLGPFDSFRRMEEAAGAEDVSTLVLVAVSMTAGPI